MLDLLEKKELKPVAPRLNLVWGGAEIAKIIGRTVANLPHAQQGRHQVGAKGRRRVGRQH